MRAAHEALVEVDNILLIVGNPQEILDQHLRPLPIYILDIMVSFFYYCHYINCAELLII